MKWHPAIGLAAVWFAAIAALLTLPFVLVGRTVWWDGAIWQAGFLAAFALGAFWAAPIIRTAPVVHLRLPDFQLTDKVIAAVIAIVWLCLAIEMYNGDFLDLAVAYETRSDRAMAMVYGDRSSSSLWFQLAFVLYPIAYVGMAREIIFRPKMELWRVFLVGAGPFALASLVMGGRGPLLYGLILLVLCLKARKLFFPKVLLVRTGADRARSFLFYLALFIVGAVAMNYFVQVFVVRAGGTDQIGRMLDFAATNWGVTFGGNGADRLRALIGDGNTYLVFVFLWYLVQGVLMSNDILANYVGPLSYGTYGIDLATAVMRRIDPGFVTDRFVTLLDMNVYGFFPSAFGSLYVDFGWGGLFVAALWGYGAGLVYRRIKLGADARWILIGPFITMGLVFSLINTPIGFGNGLITHAWVVLVFLLTGRSDYVLQLPAPQGEPVTGSADFGAAVTQP